MPKVLRLHSFEGVSGLQIDELSLVEPKGSEVRIQVEAFALNWGDFELFDDEYTFTVELPARNGDECVGVIDAVGPDVKNFKVGDRVGSLPWANPGYGVMGEFAIVPELYVSKYPDNISIEEACSIWITYMTAYYPLVETSCVGPGDFVLLPAATSSAGIAAVNIVRKQGGKSIGTTRSADNIDFLLNEVGCDYVIDTSKDSIGKKILEITGNKGCRVIYDPVGGPLLMDYADGIGKQCQIFLYGSMTRSPTVLPEIKMAMADAVLRSYTMYHHMWDPAEVERGRKYVYDGIASGEFNAIVDRVYDEFTMENVLDALKYQDEGVGRRGKIVIRTKHEH